MAVESGSGRYPYYRETRARQRGEALPYRQHVRSPQFQAQLEHFLNGELDDAGMKPVIAQIEASNSIRTCNKLQQEGALIPLSHAAKAHGIIARGQGKSEQVYNILKDLGAPLIRVVILHEQGEKQNPYAYVVNNHEGTEALWSHPLLDDFRRESKKH